MRETKVCGEGVEGDGEKEVFHVYFAFMLTGVEDDGSDRSPRCKRLIPHFSPLQRSSPSRAKNACSTHRRLEGAGGPLTVGERPAVAPGKTGKLGA